DTPVLEAPEHDSLVAVAVAPSRAAGGEQVLDARVGPDDRRDGLLVLLHLGERDALGRFGEAEDLADVLAREKALRDHAEEVDGRDEDHEAEREGRAAVPEDELQRPLVEGERPVEDAFGDLEEP